MSEACIGLEPKGWAYVASLIKEEPATGVNVYIDEPYPQIAENPPVAVASSFSLTSLWARDRPSRDAQGYYLKSLRHRVTGRCSTCACCRHYAA